MDFSKNDQFRREEKNRSSTPLVNLSSEDALNYFQRCLKNLSKEISDGKALNSLIEVLRWFLASCDISNIPYDNIFQTPISNIMLILLNNQNLPEKNLIQVVRIIGYLTSFNAPSHPCFYNPEFVNLIYQKLRQSTNNDLTKHALIIVGQILQKYPESYPLFCSLQFPQYLISNLVNSQNDEISAISSYVLSLVALYSTDSNDVDQIIQALYALIHRGKLLIILYTFRGISFSMPKSQLYFQRLVVNNFANICVETFCFLHQTTVVPEIVSMIFQLLSIIAENCDCSSFVELNIPNHIIVLNCLSQSGPQNENMIREICNFISIILVKSTSSMDNQILNSGIIKHFIHCLNLSSFNIKLMIVDVITYVIKKHNIEYFKQIVESNGLQPIVELLEIVPNEVVVNLLNILAEFCQFFQNGAEVLISLGISDVLNNLCCSDDMDVADCSEKFLSLIEQ